MSRIDAVRDEHVAHLLTLGWATAAKRHAQRLGMIAGDVPDEGVEPLAFGLAEVAGAGPHHMAVGNAFDAEQIAWWRLVITKVHRGGRSAPRQQQADDADAERLRANR